MIFVNKTIGKCSFKNWCINESVIVYADHCARNAISPKSLEECLKIYTRRENLGSGAKIRCSSCNVNQESTKRLSFKKLPLVLCFHLKRFEQNSKTRKKISDYISFPYELDLQPFMSTTHSNSGMGGGNDWDPNRYVDKQL